MFKQDWMMRQIETMARSIAYLVFQKENTDLVLTEEEAHSEVGELYRRLLEKVNAGDIGGAEDLLFEACDLNDRRYLELAVDFYSRLNDLSDAQLEAGGFARDEIQEGLTDLSTQFGVNLL